MGNKENGLRLIRVQCNMSQSYLGDILGVTRQSISDWEKGKKKITNERRKELAELFGVNEEYFGEITEAQKEEILSMPMYHHSKQDKEYYLYRQKDDTQSMVFLDERPITFDEELLAYKKEIKETAYAIENIFDSSQIHDKTRLYKETLQIMKAFMSIIQ